MSEQEQKTTVVMKKGPIEKATEAAEGKVKEMKETKKIQIPGWVKGCLIGAAGVAVAFFASGLRKPKEEPVQTYSYEEANYEDISE